MLEPQPGEVWVVTELKYVDEHGEKTTIYGVGKRPFIVLSITVDNTTVVQANGDGKPVERPIPRHRFDWSEHGKRLYPPTTGDVGDQ